MKTCIYDKKKFFIALAAYICVSFIIYRVPLSNADMRYLTISGDLVVSPSIDNYIRNFHPLWNGDLSTNNWVTISRLFLYAPFLFAVQLLQIHPMTFIEILWVITETAAGICMFILSSYVIRKTNPHIRTNLLTLASFVSGFLYMFNPYILELSHHITLKFVYSLFPLYVFTILLSFESKKKFPLILSALLLTLISSVFHYAIFGLAFLLICTLFFMVIDHKIENLAKFLKITFTYLLFSAYWLVPTIFAITTNVGLSPSYVLTKESVNMLSRNAGIINVFQFYTGWQVDKFFIDPPIPMFSPNLLGAIRILLTVFALSVLLFEIRNKYVKLFGLILLISIPFSAGSQGFSELYYWLVFNFPFGWILRSPEKFIVFVVLSTSILLSFTFVKAVRKLQKRTSKAHVLVAVILVILISISNWPLLTGDFNGDINPVMMPNEFSLVNSLFQDVNDFKVLWMPKYWGRCASWNPEHSTSAFDEQVSTKPTYQIANDPLKVYYFYTLGLYYGPNSVLSKNDTSYLGKYLAPLNVKYLVIHDDIPSLKDEITNSIANLKTQDTPLIGNESFIYVYENSNISGQLYIPSQNILLLGGLESFTSLNALNSFNPLECSLIFLNQFPLEEHYIENNTNIALNTESNGIIFPILLASSSFTKVIKPFENVFNHNPSRVWSRAGSHDPLHGDWHQYLEKREIRNWDFDYGKGLVFTWATSKMKENPTPNNNDLINQWIFNSEIDLEQWKNFTFENQFGAIHSVTLDNGALKAELWNSTWGWKIVNSPLIPAEYSNWYRWELQIKGENSHKAHIKIVEYNEEEKIVNARQVKSIGSGNFDWNTITIDFTPESPETKYIQLQIWHGHETEQPLPNVIWIDNVKIYDLQRFTEPVTLEIPFTTQETDNYVFLTCLFQNQHGGKIQIQLDNTKYTINTKDQLNKFTWKQIDTINLEKGQHKITLTNLEGFNAINLFTLIPKQEYQDAENQLEQTLQNKTIIHILEAENDLYHENTTTSNKYGGEASNGQILTLNQNSTIWQNITITKTDNYKLTTRSKGPLQIQIDNQTYTTNSTTLNWNHLNTTHLNKGNHKIQITTPNNAELDVIWLHSTKNPNETLQDIFTTKQKPAQIINYTKMNPTKYTANINATKPFMLSFAEAYDPLWTCHVNGEKISSIPLYSVINGFWINKTGQLEIVIEYEPQKWFYTGCAISITTLIACVAYLTYAYTKNKNILQKLKHLLAGNQK